MASLEAYRRQLPYSYAPGLFPTLEALTKAPEQVTRVLISSRAQESEALSRIRQLCAQHGIRTEAADRVLQRLSQKANCFAATVFHKTPVALKAQARHLVLHNPMDKGNVGTLLRTALGFGFVDVAVILPAADLYDPHVVRASMGAIFSLRVREYDDFDAYRADYPAHHLYPFMLEGAVSPETAARGATLPWALVMGNEGSGLPHAFAQLGTPVRIQHSDKIDSLNLAIAASIGMYVFDQYAGK